MNTDYTIKNFRVFDEKGVTAKIRPITILTGCNSSGKSSIAKSMVLFNGFIKDILDNYEKKGKINFRDFKLDFSKKTNSSLGNFKKILNRKSESEDVTYMIKYHSLRCGEDLYAEFIFGLDKDDELGDGYLKSFRILNEENNTIYESSKEINSYYNLNLIRNNFYRFVIGQYIIVSALDLPNNGYPDEKENKLKEELDAYYEPFSKVFGKDAICDIRSWYDRNGIDLWHPERSTYIGKYCNNNLDVLSSSLNTDVLFYIPVLGKIKDTNKDNIERVISGLKERIGYDEKIDLLIERVINTFKESKFETFIDFYRSKETEALTYSYDKVFAKYRNHRDVWNGPRVVSDAELYSIISDNSEDEAELYSEPMFSEEDDMGPLYTYQEKKEWLNQPVSFADIYTALSDLYELDKESEETDFSYAIYNMFKRYAMDILTECIKECGSSSLSYVGSSMVDVERLYLMDSKKELAILLKEYLDAKRKYLKKKDHFLVDDKFKERLFEPGEFINEWLRKFDIAQSAKINVDEKGYGVTITLYFDKEPKKGRSLADMGYGITQLFVILLRIETAIMNADVKQILKDKHYLLGKRSLLRNKKIEEEIVFSPNTLALEEPEVHLHPKYQSMLADMFVQAYKKFNVQFIVETHSEYLIRKLQTLVAKQDVESDDCSLIYVYSANEKDRPLYTPQLMQIDILDDGRLDKPFGSGFFDEADNLAMELLMTKNGKDE